MGSHVHKQGNLASLLLLHKTPLFLTRQVGSAKSGRALSGVINYREEGGDCINRDEFKKELEERLLNFAVACVNISKELPRNSAGFEKK